jgi:hypothetical protein
MMFPTKRTVLLAAMIVVLSAFAATLVRQIAVI